jgi:hypothetical protein
MADYDEDEDFFEEDEPAEKVFLAFALGSKVLTAPPMVDVHLVTKSVNTGSVAPFGLVGHFGKRVVGVSSNRGLVDA